MVRDWNQILGEVEAGGRTGDLGSIWLPSWRPTPSSPHPSGTEITLLNTGLFYSTPCAIDATCAPSSLPQQRSVVQLTHPLTNNFCTGGSCDRAEPASLPDPAAKKPAGAPAGAAAPPAPALAWACRRRAARAAGGKGIPRERPPRQLPRKEDRKHRRACSHSPPPCRHVDQGSRGQNLHSVGPALPRLVRLGVCLPLELVPGAVQLSAALRSNAGHQRVGHLFGLSSGPECMGSGSAGNSRGWHAAAMPGGGWVGAWMGGEGQEAGSCRGTPPWQQGPSPGRICREKGRSGARNSSPLTHGQARPASAGPVCGVPG